MTATTRPVAPHAPDAPVVLRRHAGVAAWWSLLGVALVAAGGFFVVDSAGHPAAWVALGTFAVVAGYFWGQLLVPSAVEVVLEVAVLRARTFRRSLDVPWDRVRLARVTRLAGEVVLIVDVWPAGVPEADRPHAVTDRYRILLPVGADIAALHRFLEARLGRTGARPDTAR